MDSYTTETSCTGNSGYLSPVATMTQLWFWRPSPGGVMTPINA